MASYTPNVNPKRKVRRKAPRTVNATIRVRAIDENLLYELLELIQSESKRAIVFDIDSFPSPEGPQVVS